MSSASVYPWQDEVLMPVIVVVVPTCICVIVVVVLLIRRVQQKTLGPTRAFWTHSWTFTPFAPSPMVHITFPPRPVFSQRSSHATQLPAYDPYTPPPYEPSSEQEPDPWCRVIAVSPDNIDV